MVQPHLVSVEGRRGRALQYTWSALLTDQIYCLLNRQQSAEGEGSGQREDMVEGAGRRSDGCVQAESVRLRSSVRMDRAVGNRAREVPEPECISGLLWEARLLRVLHTHIPLIVGLLTI